MEFTRAIYELSPYFAFLLLCFIVIYAIFRPRYPQNFPPGPRGWPIVGNMLQLAGGKGMFANFLKLRETYGDVFRVELGQKTMVVVCGVKNIEDVILSQKVDTRPYFYLPENILKGQGIIWSNGEKNTRARRFVEEAFQTQSILETVEAVIQDEVRVIHSYIESSETTDDLLSVLETAETSVLLTFITGERFTDHSSEQFKRFQQLFRDRKSGIATSNMENFFSWWTLFFRGKVTQTEIIHTELMEYFDGIVKRYQNETDIKPRGMVEFYAEQSKKSGNLEKTQAYLSVIDVVTAGYGFLQYTVQWTLLNMANHPEIQEKCREEIRQVSFNRDILLNFKLKMPYLAATLKECFRKNSQVPLSIPYVTDTEIVVNGFTLPKDTIIIHVLQTAMYDQELWKCPMDLTPERFTEDATAKDKETFVFGIGERRCVGRYLAELAQFLVVANILRYFHVTDRIENNTFGSVYKSILVPEEFKLAFKKLNVDSTSQHGAEND